MTSSGHMKNVRGCVKMTAKTESEPFGPVIYAYTRDDAIADGVIVDVTETAREMGYKIPVGVTRAVWDIIEKKPATQDIKGRLWDLLWMLSLRIRGTRAAGRSQVLFDVLMQSGRTKRWTFKAVMGGDGPNGEPCLTIMLPGED